MAWLNATPKPDKNTKRAKAEVSEDEPPKLSRLDQLKKDKITIPLPPISAPHIIDRWIEIGMTEGNGMGAIPLSWREINEWQRATSVQIAPWEAKLIRRLSTEYLAEGRRAESENCVSPWHAEVTQRERDIDQERLEMLLG